MSAGGSTEDALTSAGYRKKTSRSAGRSAAKQSADNLIQKQRQEIGQLQHENQMLRNSLGDSRLLSIAATLPYVDAEVRPPHEVQLRRNIATHVSKSKYGHKDFLELNGRELRLLQKGRALCTPYQHVRTEGDFSDDARDFDGASGVSGTEDVQNSTSKFRRNRWSSKSSIGHCALVECEKELDGTSVWLYPEFTNSSFLPLELANGGIGVGALDGASSGLSIEAGRTHVHEQDDGDSDTARLGSYAVAGLPGDDVEECTADSKEVDNSKDHDRADIRWADVADSGSEAVDETPCIDDEVELFAKELHDNEKFGKHIRIWHHKQLEPILAAPWRRRPSQTSSKVFDLTEFDSNDDCLQVPSAPPGIFNFSAKPGFGVRDLLANELHEDSTEDLNDPSDAEDQSMMHDNGMGDHNLHGDFKRYLRVPADKGYLDTHGNEALAEDLVHGNETGKSVDDTIELHVDDTLHGGTEPLHEGFVFMMTPIDDSHRCGTLVECVSADFIRTLALSALRHVYLLAERSVTSSALRDAWMQAQQLWKDRAHKERDRNRVLLAELNTCKQQLDRLLDNVIYNVEELFEVMHAPRSYESLLEDDIDNVFDELCGHHQTLQGEHATLKYEADNLKSLNMRLVKDLRRMKIDELESEAQMCFDTEDDETESEEAADAAATIAYFSALSNSIKVKGFTRAWHIEADGHDSFQQSHADFNPGKFCENTSVSGKKWKNWRRAGS